MATKTKTVAKNTTKLANTNTATHNTLSISQKEIAERAYTIYLSGKGGSQMDHWLQAEAELRKQYGKTANR